MAAPVASRRHRPSTATAALRATAGALVALAAACRTPTAAPPGPTAPPTAAATATTTPALSVVATTSIVGDVVRAVGGERAAVHVLIGPDLDPHVYKPSPGDLAALEQATIVFENGLHLEAALESLLAGNAARSRRVAVSDGVATLAAAGGHAHDGAPDDAGDGSNADEHGAADDGAVPNPHVWWDPVRVAVWADNIAGALSTADPAGRDGYAARADAYRAELAALDAWIRATVETVPPARRVLVTDHAVLAYFAVAYGFDEIGAIVPGASTAAEPSAKDLAALEDAIAAAGTAVIFVGEGAPSALAERVAADSGARLVPLRTESLSAPDGPAPNYLAFMRHNVTTIVEALRP